MKYPHVLQQGEQDCGCAAICTFLRAKGFNINLSKFNSLYYDGVSGINVKKMYNILINFNIKSKLYKINSNICDNTIDNFKLLHFPCIALVRDKAVLENHYYLKP